MNKFLYIKLLNTESNVYFVKKYDIVDKVF